MAKTPNILIFSGPCGTGKTNVAINVALNLKHKGKNVTFVDLDLMNPYFKSSDYGKSFRERGIDMISPSFSGSNLDIPVLPNNIYSIFNKPDHNFIIDVGGDDSGARVLGRFHKELTKNGYHMLFVINKYCASSEDLDNIARIAFKIQLASRLKITGIVNNSNLAESTKPSHILDSVVFANDLSYRIDIPVVMTTVLSSLVPSVYKKVNGIYPINIYIDPWGNNDLF